MSTERSAGLRAAMEKSAAKFYFDCLSGRYELPEPEVKRGPGKVFGVGDRVRLLPTNPICRLPLEGVVIEEHVESYGYQRCTVRLEGYKGGPVHTFRATDLEHA